jgi:hypothetical protein
LFSDLRAGTSALFCVLHPWTDGQEAFSLETAVETHIQAQGTEPKGFSTAPQFTKTMNSSMASNG